MYNQLLVFLSSARVESDAYRRNKPIAINFFQII